MKTLTLTKLVGPLGLALPLVLSANAAVAEDLVFYLVNDSSRVVTDFFVDDENLSDSDLNPGEEVTISIKDGLDNCVYTVQAYSAADEEMSASVDFCELYDEGFDLFITDDGFVVE